ncbi:hypothetical protein BDF21DRAFT_400085 [Thamnidium elegans]|nr:hypothetical protein BDF21DRAFT_400085 [Thamnidium elegans]
MAAAWSKLCSFDNYIDYKTPEHLCSYNNILEDTRKYRDMLVHNIEASRSIRLVASLTEDVKHPSPLKNTDVFSLLLRQLLTKLTLVVRNQNFASSNVVVICVKIECIARYGGKEECISDNNTEAMTL